MIHVALLDEAVDVWRPVEAEHVHGNVYLLAAQPYERTIEKWQFEPGDQVICRREGLDKGHALIATQRV